MSKAQGLTASAILFTGILLRPALTNNLSSTPSPAATLAQSGPTAPARETVRDGPWRASCNYWKPGIWTDDREKNNPADKKPPNLNISLKEKRATFESNLTGSFEEPDTGCGPQAWGIPVSPFFVTPHITALIATVPDPIHSSMAIEFDRSIDVLMQAAAENGYVGSYFWLPWKHHLEAMKSVQSGNTVEAREDLEREKQPGLLILKQLDSIPRLHPFETQPSAGSRTPASAALRHPSVPANTRRKRDTQDHSRPQYSHPPDKDRVIYLFLVGQTPAIGVNGEQLQRALHAESYLQMNFGADLSFKHPDTEADIIGPNNSGAAASLRAGLESAEFDSKIDTISVAGITSTKAAADALVSPATSDPRHIQYFSFGDNTAFEQSKVITLFSTLGNGPERIAFLSESGTVFGQATACSPDPDRSCKDLASQSEPLVIRFPREISIFRNAQKDENSLTTTGAEVAASPYLHLSLKDTSVEDTIPPFSPELTPFSQEAQWFAIIRELKRRHIEVVAMSASNPLDELFLAKLLHRDLPDARLVFFGTSDLMFVRYSDNAPYLGSIAFTAFPFTALSRSDSYQLLHNFANASTEALYNAAIYTLWDGQNPKEPHLADYRNPFNPSQVLRPALWATVVGRDGYYPLGIVDDCASNSPAILPTFSTWDKYHCNSPPETRPSVYTPAIHTDRPTFPSFSWYLLCLVITVLCLAHSLVLRTASFWSPLTRDLAIEHSDQPRRRAVYIHIATAMLLSMSFITVFPILPTLHLLQFNSTTLFFAASTILSAILAATLTMRRTWRHTLKDAEEISHKVPSCRRPHFVNEKSTLSSEASLYPWFNVIALVTTFAVTSFWVYLCESDTGHHGTSFVGLFFSYRSLHPASGVSPLLPILLLLFSWYLWALLQTKRLRFSGNSRPILPKYLPFLDVPAPLYVSDDALSSCSRPLDSCLYENITCLLITRQIIRRFFAKPGVGINRVLAVAYSVVFVVFVFGLPIQSLDRFLRRPIFHLTPYEFLISALFYPLLVVALTGSIRMIYIWASLSQGLLEPLERSPLRFAFSRLTNVAWMTMLRQGGLLEYWRDMTRSNEAIQQMSHNSEIADAMERHNPIALQKADSANRDLQDHIQKLLELVRATAPTRRRHGDRPQPWYGCGNFLLGKDLPHPSNRGELNLMCAIECDYANFAEALLSGVLVPYWLEKRCTPVEADLPPSAIAAKEKHEGDGAEEAPASVVSGDPLYIRLAEEFLAIRYLSVIRSVLINLRQLMTFVSAAFVLAMIAWNSYPFEPRQWIDRAFTGLLVLLGSCVIYVFAQMHRNAILSRITGTKANELGSDFYIRLITYGSVPVVTWLTSQFPEIGSSLSRLLQSGSGFAK